MESYQRNKGVEPKEQARRPRKGRLTPRKLMSLFIMGIFLYIAFSYGQGFYQIHQMKNEIAALEEKLGEIKNINRELQNQVDYLHTPEAVEKIAREKLGLIHEGEIVVMRAREAN